ncbi:hypothetical protein FJZ31_15045 [Candidatus Poribacteria bacterium]|nr:hypothetical protein [Candidatus Poribacteria bacterium]
MLSLRKQTTNILILIGIGVFMLALVGCSEQDVLSPTNTSDSDDAQFLAPPTQEMNSGMMGGNMMGGAVDDDMMNGGMMGGMMGGGMMGMMGGGMMGGGSHGWWNPDDENLTPLTIEQAVEAVQEYLAAIGNPDLALAEVMEFSNHFYAEIYEKSTGVGAFEILINLYTGTVHPEPGPNMMWNTKYGHMRRWNPRAVKPVAEMSVTTEKALENAQKFLDARLPETKVAEEADTFYGYYTIHVLKDGIIYGMLSVNGYTGQVWYHAWHGEFIGMEELED